MPTAENARQRHIHLTNVAINEGIVENSTVIKGQWNLNKTFDYLQQHPGLFNPNVTVTRDSLYAEFERVSRKAMASVAHILKNKTQ
jgi:hypothetical protein